MPKTPKLLPKSIIRKEFGNSGTEYFSGFFTEEINAVWRDQQRVTTVNQMRDQDGTIRAVLNALKAPILSAEWEIIPSSDDPKDVEIADEVRQQLFNMVNRTFQEFLREALTMFEFGHSVFEKIWGIDKDGKIILKDLAPRIQSSIQQWIIGDNEPGITQLVRNDGAYEDDKNKTKNKTLTPFFGELEIPWDKLLVFTNDREGDDMTGRSVLRPAYLHWKYKNGIYHIQAVGIEKSSIGVPTGTMPKGVGKAEKDAFEEVLKNIRANEEQIVLLPFGFEWKYVNPESSNLGSSVKDAIDHHDRHILLSVLAEFLDLGSGAGSFALSSDQSSFFLEHDEQHAKYVASQVSRGVIRDMVDYNHKDIEVYPTLKFMSFGNIDFKEMAEVYKTLTEIGVVNPFNPEELKVARRTFKLPVLDPKDIGVTNPQIKDRTEADKKSGGDVDEDDELNNDHHNVALAQKKKLKFHRELFEPELVVDFKLLNDTFNTLEQRLEDELTAILSRDIEKLKPKAERQLKSGNLVGLKDMSFVSAPQIQRALKGVMNEALEVGKKTASGEIGVGRPPTTMKDLQSINFDSSELAREMKEDIENKSRDITKESITREVPTSAGLSAIISAAVGAASLMTTNLVGFTVGENINRGRSAVFSANASDISGFMRSEVLDDRTCNMCLSLDGRIIKADDPFGKIGSVHSNCRGEWIAIKVADFPRIRKDVAKGVIGIPKTVLGNFDTVGGVPLINSFTQLKKPINRANKDVQKIIKGKPGK